MAKALLVGPLEASQSRRPETETVRHPHAKGQLRDPWKGQLRDLEVWGALGRPHAKDWLQSPRKGPVGGLEVRGGELLRRRN